MSDPRYDLASHCRTPDIILSPCSLDEYESRLRDLESERQAVEEDRQQVRLSGRRGAPDSGRRGAPDWARCTSQSAVSNSNFSLQMETAFCST